MDPSQSSPPTESRSFASSLSFRFTVMATLASLVVVAFAYVSFDGLNDLQRSNEQLQRTAQIVQRHVHADMMRDAIRGDLLAAQIAKLEQDAVANDNARKDFATHSVSLRQDIDANLAEDIPPAIKADMGAVRSALRIYISTAEAAIKALSGATDGAGIMGIFEEKYAFMEKTNRALSSSLLNWAEAAKVESGEKSRGAKLWIAAIACLALVLSITTPVYTTASIFVPLRRMQRTMQEIVMGRADLEVPYTGRKDEMGDVAKSVDVFRANIIQIREMTALQVQQQEAVQAEKRHILGDLARRFEERVQSIIHNVGSVAGELLETAQSMNGITNTTHSRAASAASESREAAQAAQLPHRWSRCHRRQRKSPRRFRSPPPWSGRRSGR